MPALENFVVKIKDKDVVDDLSPFLISVSFTDYLSGSLDNCSIELKNDDQRFSGEWCPSKGDKMGLMYNNLNLGVFYIDKISYSKKAGGARTCIISALDTKLEKRNIRTPIYREYKNALFSQVLAGICSKSDMQLKTFFEDFTIDEIVLDGPCGREMKKLAQSRNCYVKIKDNVAIVTDRDYIKEKYDSIQDISDDLLSVDFELVSPAQGGAGKPNNACDFDFYEEKQISSTNTYAGQASAVLDDTVTALANVKTWDASDYTLNSWTAPTTQVEEQKRMLRSKNTKKIEGSATLKDLTVMAGSAFKITSEELLKNYSLVVKQLDVNVTYTQQSFSIVFESFT